MKFNDLQTTHKQSPKRVGRGIAAGQGKTAGRGTKGYGARTGSKAKPGFVGGQNPIMQALPKLPGFRSHIAKMENVTTRQITNLGLKTVTVAELAQAGLVTSPFARVKLLASGEVASAVTIHIQAASAAAIEHVKKAGGSVTITARTPRPASGEKVARKAKKAAKA